MSQQYILVPSPRSGKKWRVTTPWGKNVDFGATGYSDYTLHKDPSRQENYISRHASRENWTKNGTDTAGFWSRWLLWNLPDFMESVRDIESKFGIQIDTSGVITNSDGSPISGNVSSINGSMMNQSISLPPAPSLPVMSPSTSSLPPITIPIQSVSTLSVPTLSVPTLSTPTLSTPTLSTPTLSMSSLPPVPRSPTMSRLPSTSYAPSSSYLPTTSLSVPNMSPLPVASALPVTSSIPTASSILYSTPANNNNNFDPIMEEYTSCKEEAAERKAKGKLKLCPEGYCTVKLTEDVYPSYSANVRASKICSGQLEDYEGNTEDYYGAGQ